MQVVLLSIYMNMMVKIIQTVSLKFGLGSMNRTLDTKKFRQESNHYVVGGE